MNKRDVVLQFKLPSGDMTSVTALKNIEDTADVKATPSADDYIPIIDSSEGGQMKKTPASALRGLKGDKGDTGAQGETGATGPQGPKGDTGAAATVTVGTVTTGAAGSSASVTNAGTSSAAKLNFTIPQGAKGDKGDKGADGAAGAKGVTFTPSVSSAGVLSWSNDGGLSNPASVNIKGPKGDDATATAITDTEIDNICK